MFFLLHQVRNHSQNQGYRLRYVIGDLIGNCQAKIRAETSRRETRETEEACPAGLLVYRACEVTDFNGDVVY